MYKGNLKQPLKHTFSSKYVINTTIWGTKCYKINGAAAALSSLKWKWSLFFDCQNLKTLFNIVEDRFKKLLNFDVSAV